MDRFTTVPMVGVDVGSAAIKIVELARAGGRIVLRRCVVGRRDGSEPAELLKRLLNDAGFTTYRAAVGVAAPDVIVKPFVFPPMPKKELASAVRLEAEEAILDGHKANEITIDWHTLSSSHEAVRGILAVMPKAVLADRLELVKAAGLRPLIADVEGLALWNAYWTLVGARQSQQPKTVLVMNLGARTTTLVIAKESDELMLVRDVQLGHEAFVHERTRDWTEEISDSLAYARGKAGLRQLDEVVVSGGGSGPHVIGPLRSIVNAPLTFWNPLQQLERDADSATVDEAAGPLLAIAIGLALRQP